MKNKKKNRSSYSLSAELKNALKYLLIWGMILIFSAYLLVLVRYLEPLSGSIYFTIEARTPASSITSRKAVCSKVSPFSTVPLGSTHPS